MFRMISIRNLILQLFWYVTRKFVKDYNFLIVSVMSLITSEFLSWFAYESEIICVSLCCRQDVCEFARIINI